MVVVLLSLFTCRILPYFIERQSSVPVSAIVPTAIHILELNGYNINNDEVSKKFLELQKCVSRKGGQNLRHRPTALFPNMGHMKGNLLIYRQ